MNKIFKFISLGGMVVLLLCTSVFASLTLDIGVVTDQNGATISKATILANINNYFDCYHSNPTNTDPRVTTNKLNIAPDLATYNTNPGLDPATFAFDYSTGKYHGYITSDNKVFFVRGASTSAPGGTVYVRVWSGSPNAQGSYYCLPKSFANGALSGTSGTLAAAIDYKADVPYAPEVWKFDESTTTIITPASTTSNLTAYGRQPAATDGKRQVTGWDWKMWVSTDTEPTATEGVNNSELVKGSATLIAGETYSFKAAAKNWFSEPNFVWGNAQDYQVGGGPGVVTPVGPITYNLIAPEGGIGINAISILHSVPFSVKDVGDVETIRQLVDAVNAKANDKVVTAVGILTDNQIQGAYVTYDQQGNPTFTPTAGFAGEGTKLERGMSLQISVNKSVEVTFQ